MIDVQLFLPRSNFTLDVSVSIPEHGITALFGPSGCGKTTLLRAIAGLEKTARGHVRIGRSVWQDEQRFLPTHQRALGYVFQEACLFDHLSVQDNLLYGYKRLDPSQRHFQLEQVVALLGLDALLTRQSTRLSGGERQRVAIGRALLCSPQLLLMDEPLAALDTARKREILPFFERLHHTLAIPILYVSHAMEEVARLADHLVLLHDGQVRAHGPTSEILTRADLPLAHDHDAAAIVEATVEGHDDEFQLTRLCFGGGLFHVPLAALAVGQPIRLRVLARDVSLTLEHQTGTSILNIVPVSITAMSEEDTAPGGSQLLVQLDAGGTPLLARVTRKSAAALALTAGKSLFAQIKAVALLD